MKNNLTGGQNVLNGRQFGSASVRADNSNDLSQNKTILQGFEWFSPGTITSIEQDPDTGFVKDQSVSHWKHLTQLLPQFVDLGFASMWIPPACKATNPKDEGYGIYDLYDLGEFDTKGSTATKWGTKQELQDLCSEAQRFGVDVVFDAVLNHKAAPDGAEEGLAIRVNPKNRLKNLDTKPRMIEAWTKFNFDARQGRYSTMKYNNSHFSGVDWDCKQQEKSIFKFVGKRPDGTMKDWADDVGGSENGNYDFLMFADVDFGNDEVKQDVKRWARWLLDELPGIRGFRLDAAKHYSSRFQREFVDHVKSYADESAREFFFVGEYWMPDSKVLNAHIDKTFSGKVHMFDIKLLYNLHDISIGRLRDLRKVFVGSLASINPSRAVTFVTNHDTQETQSLASPIEPWFIPHAYALILLRSEGQPCVFWGDMYGTDGPQPRLPACGGRLVRLIKARQLFAYGKQYDDFSASQTSSSPFTQDKECIFWQRGWQSMTHGHIGLVVLASISWSWKKRRVNVGSQCAGQIWTDLMGWAWSGVLIDKHGFGDFPVGARSISVWTWQNAPGRDQVDDLVYPPEPDLVPDTDEVTEEVLPAELRT